MSDHVHISNPQGNIWIGKTQWGNYSVCEEVSLHGCGAITIFATQDLATGYVAHLLDPTSEKAKDFWAAHA